MSNTAQLVCSVIEVCPRGLYLVRTDSGRTFQAALVQVGRPTVRLAPGDLVLVRPSQADPTRARIVEKLIP